MSNAAYFASMSDPDCNVQFGRRWSEEPSLHRDDQDDIASWEEHLKQISAELRNETAARRSRGVAR